MSGNTHLQVSFPASYNDGVSALAKHLLEGTELEHEALWFLQSMADRSGENLGTKGGLVTWGTVGKLIDPLAFVYSLIPFWTGLFSAPNAMMYWERIVVLYEREQTEAASAIEILMDEELGLKAPLIIRHHEGLPFCWCRF